MKKFSVLSMLLLMVCSLGFVSCDKDDEEDDLIGKWELTWSKGYEIYNGDRDSWDQAESGTVIIFNKDKTGSMTFVDGSSTETNSFTWELNGDKLTMKKGNDPVTVTLKSISSKEIKVEIHEVDGEDEFYSLETFKKK